MAYVTQSSDTTEAAERAQIEVLRRIGMDGRVRMMRRLSLTQRSMAWAALKKANPRLSEVELKVKAVAIWYGEEHAAVLEAALRERGEWI